MAYLASPTYQVFPLPDAGPNRPIVEPFLRNRLLVGRAARNPRNRGSKMHRLRRGILLGIIGTSACSHYRYTHTAYEKFEPSSKARCEFRVLSTLPADGKYVEIGVINLVNGDAAGTTDVNRFKQEVQANVCSARGDVVVGEVNPQGFYVRGTVFRKVNQ